MRYILLGVGLLPLLTLLSWIASPPPCAVAGEEAAGALRETWDRLHVDGAHSGYVHTVVRTVEQDGEKRIETHATTDMKMVRMGSTTHIHSVSDTWETPDGKLLRIATLTKMSAQEMRTIFTFTDGKLAVETSVMGNTRKAESAVDKDLLGPAYAERAMKALAGTDGKEVRIKTYSADFQRPLVTVGTSRGLEPTELHDGTTVKLTRVESAIEGVPALRPVTWLDDEGRVRKVSMKMSGLTFDTFRVASKADAMVDESKPREKLDVFAQTLLVEKDPIPVPRHLERATIEMRMTDASIPFPGIGGNGVTVERGTDDTHTLKLRRVVPAADKGGVRPLSDVPAALQDALAPSSMIQADAEGIRKVAADVVGDEKSAWRAAQKLERWVFENVTKKNMNVAFGSALEALETREGDCTEHAVLLAALCRAAGIPARVVMGLEYLFGIWGGHAWNDVWIDGAWYPLDATNGYGFVDPLHIPMSYMVMKDGGENGFVELLGGLGNLEVDIVSVVRDGREIPVQASAELVKAKDGRYRDAIWGLQFDVPSGFVFDPPSKGKGMSAKLMELDGKTADGKTVEIRIDAMDAPARDGALAFVKQMGADPATAKKSSVDGRAAHTVTSNRGGRSALHTLIVVDGALFIFTLDRPGAEAERKAYEAFLASVDFDVR